MYSSVMNIAKRAKQVAFAPAAKTCLKHTTSKTITKTI